MTSIKMIAESKEPELRTVRLGTDWVAWVQAEAKSHNRSMASELKTILEQYKKLQELLEQTGLTFEQLSKKVKAK